MTDSNPNISSTSSSSTDFVVPEKYKKWLAVTNQVAAEQFVNGILSRIPEKDHNSIDTCLNIGFPLLQRIGHGILAEAGDIPCFLRVDLNNKNMTAQMVVADEDPLNTTSVGDLEKGTFFAKNEQEVRNLVKAFMFDFPEAGFVCNMKEGGDFRHIVITPSQDEDKKKVKTLFMPLSKQNMESMIELQIFKFKLGIQ